MTRGTQGSMGALRRNPPRSGASCITLERESLHWKAVQVPSGIRGAGVGRGQPVRIGLHTSYNKLCTVSGPGTVVGIPESQQKAHTRSVCPCNERGFSRRPGEGHQIRPTARRGSEILPALEKGDALTRAAICTPAFPRHYSVARTG